MNRTILIPKSIAALITLLISFNCFSAQSETPLSVKNSSSLQAYSGVFNTPNSEVIDWGDFGFSYSDNFTDRAAQYIDQPGFVTANDMKFGVGLLPNLEIIGRLSTRNWHCNSFEESGCGFRDLSGSFKWKIPFIPKKWLSLAFGGQDVAGASSFSEAYYLTASKELSVHSFGSIRSNIGVATSNNAIGYMDGFFASLEYQPVEYLQLAAEYDANAVNVGVKVFAPGSWLPNGWDLYVSAQLYSSDDERNERDTWFNAGVSIPLGGVDSGKNTRSSSAAQNNVRMNSDQPGLSESGIVRSDDSFGDNVQDSDLGSGILLRSTSPIPGVVRRNDGSLGLNERISMLAQRLVNEGFESVSVGLANDAVVIRVENNIYNRNEMDAVAVVRHLSLVALGDVQGAIEITNSGIVSYAAALRKGVPEQAGNDGVASGNDGVASGNDGLSLFASQYNSTVNWLVKNENSSHFTPRLILAPEVKSLVGTEYGAFDYEVAISSRLQMSLWDGGVIEVRHLSGSVVNSDDFDEGEYYQVKYGLDEGIDTRLFHQTFVLPYNVFTKFSYGRIYGEHDGLLNETRWADNTNTHRVTTLVGDFENDISVWGGKKTLKQQPKLIKYRYRYHPLNWDMEITAGEYWRGDKGFTLRSLHWFGDVQVGLRYRKTKFDVDGGEEEDFIAFGFSIPLNFAKSMKPNYGVQVMGTEQWDYYVETNLESAGTANLIKTGFGQEPSLYHNLNRAYFNRDRD